MISERARLTAFFGERDRSDGFFLADRVLDVAAVTGLDHSVILQGSEGFGSKHRLQSAGLLTLSEDLPMIAEGTGSRDTVEAAADRIRGLAEEGLITVEAVEAFDSYSYGEQSATGLRVWLRRGQRLADEPAHIGVIRLLARQGAAAAVTLLGVDGTTSARRERASFFSWNGSVPMFVLATGDPDTIARCASQIHALLPGATIELLGTAMAAPSDAESRVTVFGTEAPGPDGRPLHSTLVRTVRESGGSGATVLSGIYGFTGLTPPRGDSLFQLRRRVPVLTEIVDTAEACDRWEELARGLGGERVAISRAPVTVLRPFDRG